MKTGVAALAIGLAFVVGYAMPRAIAEWDPFGFIAAVGLAALVMGLVGLYDQSEAAA
jgi:hypothetical protein